MKGIRTLTSLMAIALVAAGGIHWNDAYASVDPDSGASHVATLPAGAGEVDGVDRVAGPTTDPGQASQLPREDLSREEAIELLTAVFDSELEAPAGPFDDLRIAKFLADNVAVIAAGDQPESVEDESDGTYNGPSLMVSTIPLRVDGQSGVEETVELDLNRVAGELQPVNALIEVAVPPEIGEGIALPEEDLSINLEGVPGQIAPTTVDKSVAVYPNISQDTDFVVAPTPTGVETFTHLRSANAPTSQTFDLGIPEGAALEETEEGGAVISRGDQPLIEVPPPDAIDASGNQVPVRLEVVGSSLILTAEPDDSALYPILVDPLYQSYKWEAGKPQTGIHYSTGEEEWTPGNASLFYEYPWCMPCYPFKTSSAQESSVGLSVRSGAYPAKTGEHAAWNYAVPRYFKDPGEKPTSFISKFTLIGLTQWANSPYHDPHLVAGIWDVFKKEWGSPIVYHEGLEGHSLNDANWEYPMPNPNGNVNDKIASVGLWATEDTPSGAGSIKATTAIVELAEPTDPAKNRPVWGVITPPSAWMNETAVPIDFTVTDTGLGVRSLKARYGKEVWETLYGCTGVGGNACPRTWQRPWGTQPNLQYDPAKLPQGITTLVAEAEDPLGNRGEAAFQVQVDHTPPKLEVGGSARQQGFLGTHQPTYSLTVNVADGTTAAPQSGATFASIEVDGTVKKEWSDGCPTRNCALAKEWTLTSADYRSGIHTIKVKAKDGVGLTTEKSFSINLQPQSPALEVEGSLLSQKSLGTTRPRYSLWLGAEASGDGPLGQALSTSYGSYGTGPGSFNKPGGVAVDSQGNVLVADQSNNRVQTFNSSGVFQSSFGTTGSANGQFSRPIGIAVTPKEKIFVTDCGNNRVQQFTKAGTFVSAFGKTGPGPGFITCPIAIAVDSKEILWVTDMNGKVQQFNQQGEFIKSVAAAGSKPGGFQSPAGIAFASNGQAFILESLRNEVQIFSESGIFLKSFGTSGSGPGELQRPTGIAIDKSNHIWIAEEENHRLQEFDLEGNTLGTVGSLGASMMFKDYSGLAVDSKSGLWVSNGGVNRLDHWTTLSGGSKVKVTTTVDGKVADSGEATCSNIWCPLERAWFLEAKAYPPGPHAVTVKAEDGFGNVTSKTMNIELQPDVIAPALTVTGQLISAPEGWVEQDPYTLTATATDAVGYGVTEVKMLMDGQVAASSAKACPNGACSLSLSKTLDMEQYTGGAHDAEIVATDGAGNTAKKSWTINVDPDGHVSAVEVIDTLQAADETAESTVVAPASAELEPEQMEGGDNPSLFVSGNQIESEGIPNTTSMSTDPSGGFTIEGPEGKTSFTPAVSETASKTTVTAGVAAVSANTSSSVDTIIRPVFNGAQTFQAIRSPSSPEKYSWTVKLAASQKLVAIDEHFAKVIYEDGSTAFLITAEAAHDVTGAEVPTSIEVSGNVLTLKVAFKSGQFTFPIIAGQGWETSYEIPTYVELPEDEHEIYLRELAERQQREEEERARAEAEGVVFPEGSEPPPPTTPLTEKQAKWYVSLGPCCEDTAPPPYPNSNEASASTIRTFTLYRSQCGPSCGKWKAKVYNAAIERGYKWARWEPGTEVHATVTQNLAWEPLIWDTTWNCGTIGPTFVKKGSGDHMIAYAHFTIESWFLKKGSPTATPTETNFGFQAWVYPNGFQEKHINNDWHGQPADQTCPKVAGT